MKSSNKKVIKKVMKKVLPKKQYTVYCIRTDDGTILYIGRTNDLKKRQYDHNRLLNNGYKKDLYNYLRLHFDNFKIELVSLYHYNKKIDSKRKEMQLILNSYFSNSHTLIQKIPNIQDF